MQMNLHGATYWNEEDMEKLDLVWWAFKVKELF